MLAAHQPGRAELRAACLAGVVEPGSIARGRTDHIPFGRCTIDPTYLQPGDLLAVRDLDGHFPLVEIADGWVRLRQVEGSSRPFRDSEGLLTFSVRPDRILEGPIMLSSVRYTEFQDGYSVGFESFVLGMPLGNKSQKRKPSDFGRGFKAGFQDAEDKRFRDPGEAYNEAVRRLRALYPGEHWARSPVAPWEQVAAFGFPLAAKNEGASPT